MIFSVLPSSPEMRKSARLAEATLFFEIQVVQNVHQGSIAGQWGLKEEQVVLMIHTGSVSLGYHSGPLPID